MTWPSSGGGGGAPTGPAGGDLSGTYPNPGVAKLNGVAAALYALLASPAFTGTPTAPTAALATNTTQLATTAFVIANAGTAGLTSAHIFVGNGSNVATDVALSGDATMANTGAITIANLAITNAKIAAATIDLTAKVTGVLPIVNGGTNSSTAAGALANLSGVATGSFSMNGQKITSLLDGSAVTDAATINNINTVPLNNQTGTSYTLVLGDAGELVTLSNAGPIALTIPANASVAFPIGTQIQILQLGAGQVTVGITSDTLNATPGKKTRAQYSMATLTKITSTSWIAAGDLSA